MANALKGKSTVFMTFIAPNSDAAETLRLFFEHHFEFMKEKKSQGRRSEINQLLHIRKSRVVK